MKKYFESYLQFREDNYIKPGDGGITSKIKLTKKEGSKEFAPLVISRNERPNLRILVQAFINSPHVGLGYTTLDKSKGEIEPQLKKKSLYLTGGAVRDHLKGKTPNGYDLVTDATASEIRLILTQPEFKFIEIQPDNPEYKNHKDYSDLPPQSSKNKVFYASRWDKKGKELEFTILINKEPFYLATMSKSSKSRMFVPSTSETASTIEDDAGNRDFTINSMYIPLNNPDGENNELMDIYGGAHDLKNAILKPVHNKLEDRLEEDPATSFRYSKLAPRFGNPNKIDEKIKKFTSSGKLNSLPRHVINKEYVSGLEHPDCNPRKYLKVLHNHGMLNSVFPNLDHDVNDMPPNLNRDRWIASAWILRKNDPNNLKLVLTQNGWNKNEASDIAYLVKLYNWAKSAFNPQDFYDIRHAHTGLTKSKIKDFFKLAGAECPASESFLKHDDSEFAPYINSNQGIRTINPVYSDFVGRNPTPNELPSIQKALSTMKWMDMFR